MCSELSILHIAIPSYSYFNFKISKTAVNFPVLSRNAKKHERRAEEIYPPRMVLTIYKTQQTSLIPTTSPIPLLHVNVRGIADQSSICQGFNLPTFKRGMV